jgi:predicted nucleic acid-binding Zn ribbon protein
MACKHWTIGNLTFGDERFTRMTKLSLQSIGAIVNALERQTLWQERRAFDRLLKAWPDAVGMAVSKHTRPLEIRQDVLQVATSNSVWAQQLGFQRQRILAKLNVSLTRPLKDIRFSPGQWHRRSNSEDWIASADFLAHPCCCPLEAEVAQKKRDKVESMQPTTAREAFDRWAQKIQARSRSFPLCPSCQCPTPPKELERWSVCALCSVDRGS